VDPPPLRHLAPIREPIGSYVSVSDLYKAESDCFAEHEPVSFGRSKRHLASVPRFIGRRLSNLGSGCHCAGVEGIDRIDCEVRDVAVVAQLGRW